MQQDLFSGYMAKKRCPYCGKVKDISEFYVTKSGIQSYCKVCQKIYKRKHPRTEYKKNKRDDYSLNLFEK